MSQNPASREAYEIAKPAIPQSQLNVLRLFKHGIQLCQHDVVKALGVEINKVNPRVNELVGLGYIKSVGRRKTVYSAISVNFYEITESGKEYLQPKQTTLSL